MDEHLRFIPRIERLHPRQSNILVALTSKHVLESNRFDPNV